jgi:hypothetical protein
MEDGEMDKKFKKLIAANYTPKELRHLRLVSRIGWYTMKGAGDAT